MKIICSSSIPYAKEAFGTLGDVEILPPSSITRERVRRADLLCIRSTTRAGRALLDGSRVRFVGTATIGTDHMDLDYMKKAGIKWSSAPGCNANSVSEYVAAALLCLARRHGFTLEGRSVGVIGVGSVGGLVARKAEALGLRALLNDPPRSDSEGDPVFRPLDDVLAESDILTLHVPLNRGGRYPTERMADGDFFRRLKPGCVFMNTARGAVVDSDALIEAVDRGIVAHAVVDTWEGEPVFRSDVLGKAALGTPHIAGYSFDGKVAGTVIIYREACRFLGAEPEWTPGALLPEPVVPEIRFNAEGLNDESALHDIVRKVYDIGADDRRMRAAAADGQRRGESFEQLRRDYPERREFQFTRVTFRHARPRLVEKTAALGFGAARE